MAKKGGSAPAAPDPAATAAAQGAANVETATRQGALNRVNEYTPYGNSVYSKIGDITDPNTPAAYARTTTLDPAQQAIVDQQTAISGNLNTLAGDQLGRVSTSLADPYSFDGMPAAPTADTAARQSVIDALYGQATSRLDPRFTEERSQLDANLANQGIGVGSDAYNSSIESFGRTKNDAYTSALNQATVGGGAEQSRLFGLQGSQRERAIQEYTQQRNAPLNEVSALMSGTQINNPQFSPTPQTAIAGTDIAGMYQNQYLGQQNAYNQQQGANNAMMGGLFGLGGAAIGGQAYSKGLW